MIRRDKDGQGMNYNKLLSKRARRIVELAKEASREYGQGYVGTEHLLLGIVREGTSVAAELLDHHGATEQKVQAVVDELVKERLQDTWVLGRLPGTPHFRDVLANAAAKSRGSGNWQIRSVHLLEALLRERNSTGQRALAKMGVSVDSVRAYALRAAEVEA